MKTARAINRNVRISPDKIRVMVKQIKGLSLKDAQNYLRLSQRKASGPLLKTINSAIANAVNNESMNEATLEIKELQIGESMTYKKPKYRARGRMDIMRSTFSHIRVQVGAVVNDTGIVEDSIDEKEDKKQVKEDVEVTTKQEEVLAKEAPKKGKTSTVKTSKKETKKVDVKESK